MKEPQEVTYKSLFALTISAIGILTILVIGWIKSAQDVMDTKVSVNMANMQVMQNISAEHERRLTAVEGKQDALRAQVGTNAQDIADLKRQLDKDSAIWQMDHDWIEAHLHADKAIRELKR